MLLHSLPSFLVAAQPSAPMSVDELIAAFLHQSLQVERFEQPYTLRCREDNNYHITANRTGYYDWVELNYYVLPPKRRFECRFGPTHPLDKMVQGTVLTSVWNGESEALVAEGSSRLPSVVVYWNSSMPNEQTALSNTYLARIGVPCPPEQSRTLPLDTRFWLPTHVTTANSYRLTQEDGGKTLVVSNGPQDTLWFDVSDPTYIKLTRRVFWEPTPRRREYQYTDYRDNRLPNRLTVTFFTPVKEIGEKSEPTVTVTATLLELTFAEPSAELFNVTMRAGTTVYDVAANETSVVRRDGTRLFPEPRRVSALWVLIAALTFVLLVILSRRFSNRKRARSAAGRVDS